MAVGRDNKALAALAWAIINEKDGYHYYSKLAENLEDEQGKTMFGGLAKDEVKHYQILAAEYLSLRDRGEWLTISEAKIAPVPEMQQFQIDESDFAGASIPEERLFPNPDRVIPSLGSTAGELEALDLALKAEKRGYDLYRQAYEQADDENAKAAYKLLLDEENRHYEWLQRSRNYLANNDVYWDDTELPFFTA